MNWYRRYSGSLLGAVERSGRARALSILRNMDPRLLSEAGFSPELMQLGIKAWPWRAERVNSPKVASVQVGSPEVVRDTAQMVGGSPAKFVLGRDDSSDAPAIAGGVDNDVAA